ncbi:glycogen debranching N-terminal domain-containing protein [Streptomyces aidingensis]|uniref:Glycogen debranching enzyme (Alpha-1,6-glucosidase) n=1 Tax=Streptomyces aidingensis TaxID=910347 RepID=A0A1I1FWE9_9ACTN|nr:glycogen debranching N-terminal domain-containing protein [Streptomyces aidingensis]SFC01373.1 Glycogen debranching enzyme (alpha-1,6-glucosidase) [Streptomyces aidingensis]
MNATHHRLLVHNGTFAAVGPSGDITGARGSSPDGLFAFDARHLSRWQLTVDGSTPTVLVPASEGGMTASCVLVPPSGRGEPPALTVFREQTVTSGTLMERLRLTSNRAETSSALVALTVDADFTDQFELRSDHRWYDKSCTHRTRELLDDGVEFGYHRHEWHASTQITSVPPPDQVEETGSGARRLVWRIELAPHATVELLLRAAAQPYGAPESADGPDEFLTAAPLPWEGSDWPDLARTCARSLADLAGLRIPAAGPDGEMLRVPAAGVPWFLTLLARHALFTSLFTLPHRPELAAATLPALAATQAAEEDAARVAQPGKIVHEVRHGELAYFEQVPYGRYYGSVDSTPLFLVLLGAYTERTGDDKPAQRLERHARAAVDWMFTHGGLDDCGYLAYHPDEGGLSNQSWKDSPGAICFADGAPVKGVVRAAAPQGYAYDALRRTAWLARMFWHDTGYAARLEQAANELKARFARDFWMPGQRFPALALDESGRPADALGSDAGHLLWSGILGPEQATAVGRRLLEPDFFSGWGVRTLAAGQGAYHPLSYHCGSVWPHDNAVIALGLARYGLREETRAVARGLVRIAAAHDYRLPEVIAGYSTEDAPRPVPYPHACTPQAWAAAAPFALLTAVAAARERSMGHAVGPRRGAAANPSGIPVSLRRCQAPRPH